MTRNGSQKRVAADFWQGRHANARTFHEAARSLFALAERGQNTNAILAQIVNAAIAYADAITARRGGVVNQQDHQALTQLLRAHVGNRLPGQQAANLRAILGEKDAASYGARPGSYSQAEALLARLDGFAAWAEDELNR
jgi:hypothetical protein